MLPPALLKAHTPWCGIKRCFPHSGHVWTLQLAPAVSGVNKTMVMMEIINRRKSLLFILIRWEFLTLCFVRVSKREFWGISWSGSRGVTLVFKHADDFFKDLRKHGRLDLIFKSTGSVWISRVCRRTFVFLIFVLAVRFSIIPSGTRRDSQTIPFPGGRWGVNVSARGRTRLAFDSAE